MYHSNIHIHTYTETVLNSLSNVLAEDHTSIYTGSEGSDLLLKNTSHLFQVPSSTRLVSFNADKPNPSIMTTQQGFLI